MRCDTRTSNEAGPHRREAARGSALQVRHVYDPQTRARMAYCASVEYCALTNLSADEVHATHHERGRRLTGA